MPIRRRTLARSKRALLLAAMAAGGAAIAADAPPMPEGFLEYLGSWEAGDADWLVANAAAESAPTASDAATKQRNPTTTEKRGAAQSPATTEHKP
jgi:hypothetical protein